MNTLRCFAFFTGGLAALLLPAATSAAVLIHHYTLNNTADDALGRPSLVALGGNITAFGYVFAANRGLLFTSPLFNATDFSLEFNFRFNSSNGNAKIVDFHQLSVDSGLYKQDSRLAFEPIVQATPVDFAPGTTVNVVLTRGGATEVVAGYVNGVPRFSFLDLGLLAVTPAANASLVFFIDDFATNQNDASGGRVDSIRIFNGAFSAAEVSTLFTTGQPPLAIPEPSTVALLIVGTSIVLVTAHRRKNR